MNFLTQMCNSRFCLPGHPEPGNVEVAGKQRRHRDDRHIRRPHWLVHLVSVHTLSTRIRPQTNFPSPSQRSSGGNHRPAVLLRGPGGDQGRCLHGRRLLRVVNHRRMRPQREIPELGRAARCRAFCGFPIVTCQRLSPADQRRGADPFLPVDVRRTDPVLPDDLVRHPADN